MYLLLDEGIDITCLNILSEEMMKELVPKIGHRAKLKANTDEWKKVLDLTSSQITIMVSTVSKISIGMYIIYVLILNIYNIYIYGLVAHYNTILCRYQ